MIDYLILGHGLCGTWLSYYLRKAGKKVIVIDQQQPETRNQKPETATRAASGIINPVTGRRIVRTWRIEELLPFAQQAYTELGNELNCTLVKQVSTYDFHPSPQMELAFRQRQPQEQEYLHIVENNSAFGKYFSYPFGVGEISPCLLIDLHTMLNKWREKLTGEGAIITEEFTWKDITVNEGHVTYKDITASKLLCCEGVAGFNNPYFRNLPYSHMKGEAIIARIEDLPRNAIYKHGYSIVPWKDDLFWIGSSYEWQYEDLQPTALFRQKVEGFLNQFLRVPYTIVDHIAADRPSNMERRPFVGLHPQHPAIGILNGMGTKGCSLAPFFANQLTNHLTHSTPIYPDADVKRFTKVLTRPMN